MLLKCALEIIFIFWFDHSRSNQTGIWATDGAVICGLGGGGKERGMAPRLHPQPLTHTLCKISGLVSSSVGDARGLESDSPSSPAAPPPAPLERSFHIWSCSWVLLLGSFQGGSWLKGAGGRGGQLVRGPVNGPNVGSWGQGDGAGLRGRAEGLERPL